MNLHERKQLGQLAAMYGARDHEHYERYISDLAQLVLYGNDDQRKYAERELQEMAKHYRR